MSALTQGSSSLSGMSGLPSALASSTEEAMDRSDVDSAVDVQVAAPSAASSALSLSAQSNGGGNTSGSSLTDVIVARFERDVKIRDGAEHFLSSNGESDEDLISQVHHELFAAHARIASAYVNHLQLVIHPGFLSEMLHTASELSVPSDDTAGSPFTMTNDETQHLAIALYTRIARILDENARMRYELPANDLIAGTFPALAESADTEMRATVYSLLRHALVDPPWQLISAYRKHGIDLYLARTFLRDQRCGTEREQALKLVRTVMEIGAQSQRFGESTSTLGQDKILMTPAIVRAISSAADQTDDPLRTLFIETLAELSLLSPHEIAANGGLRCLLQASADATSELAPELVSGFLSLVDMPATRTILKPGFDLDGALSALTEPRNVDAKELTAAAHLVGVFLRSWTGFMYLCLNEKAALRSLLTALAVQTEAVQDEILDLFGDFFSSRQQDDLQNGNATASWNPRFRPLETPVRASRMSLIESYQLLVASTLLSCGIVDSLVSIIKTRPGLTSKALQMMDRLRALAASALPGHSSYKVHAVPDIVLQRFRSANGRSEQEAFELRETASSVLATLNDFSTKRLGQYAVVKNRDRSDSSKQAAPSTVLVEDGTFRTLLFDANVLGTKDHTKWSFDALYTLFNGVLQNGKRLEEAMRASKLVRRVLAFYHPYAMQYSTLPRNSFNQKYTKLGCALMQTLVANPDGIKYLAEDRLLPELTECLDTEIMSERRLEYTVAGGYFEMIGVLSKSPEGIELMQDAKLFTALYKAMDSAKRTDVAHHLLLHLDFEIDGQARVLLGRVLTHPSRRVRIEGTRRVAEMARHIASRWLVRLLVHQLYDPIAEIRELASNVLLRECTRSTKTLQMVVSMRPMLEDGAHALLLKFLSTSHGFEYLMQGDYIDREMDEWYHRRIFLYATEVEVLLARAFSPRRQEDDAHLEWDGSVPPHFYGELVKTPEGRSILTEKGHFGEFAHFVRQHADEAEDAEVLLKLKSILWLIGNMGASSGGISFLEAEDIVAVIVKMANTTPVYSLRGICFFVLGMIASTLQGAELVQDEGWEVAVSHSLEPDGPYGVCVPSQEFLALSHWKPWQPTSHVRLPLPTDKLEREIVIHLASLGNAIIVTKASRALTKLKERFPHYFVVPNAMREYIRRQSADTTASMETMANATRLTDNDASTMLESKDGASPHQPFPPAIELFVRALHLMDTHPLRPNARRYVWELFEARLDQSLVQAIVACRDQLTRQARYNGHGDAVDAAPAATSPSSAPHP